MTQSSDKPSSPLLDEVTRQQVQAATGVMDDATELIHRLVSIAEFRKAVYLKLQEENDKLIAERSRVVSAAFRAGWELGHGHCDSERCFGWGVDEDEAFEAYRASI